MIGWISNFGAAVIREVRGVGKFGLFSVQVLRKLTGARGRAVMQQIHFLGNGSLLIIAVSGLFVGFVLGLQGYYTLVSYGSEQALGVLVALSLVRELGPVVTALLFAGRAGTPPSAFSAPGSSGSDSSGPTTAPSGRRCRVPSTYTTTSETASSRASSSAW